MQPIEFISKWKAVDLSERAAAHSHFIDLCALVGEDNPIAADPTGETYCFERGAVKTTGRPGWADVWKKECFGWEYKKKRRNLTEAFVQLQQYAIALDNPPLLVVSDIDRIEVHTNWTNTVSEVYSFTLDDLRDARTRDLLKCVWNDTERFKPGKTRAALTEEAAGEFATLAQRLRSRGQHPELVAHFINRLVFCMFAEDAGLLPERMFKRMLEQARRRPGEFTTLGTDLFRAMKDPGGRVGFERVEWFNGGLFDDDTVLPLKPDDIALLQRAADLNWSEIDTTIFGTLFERGLDPDKRSQLGAHYTDRDKIQLIVDPVITRPLLAEWAQIKETITSLGIEQLPRRRRMQDQSNLAEAAYRAFIAKLRAFRVLDPACGSGNFLYVALLALKDIEHQIIIEAEALGFQPEFPQIGPEAVLGIEINPYAAELARITVWIGEIQWMRRNGFNVSREPILKPLHTIECRDAILNVDGSVAVWPDANVIIGNPPFLGNKRLIQRLGEDYIQRLRRAFFGNVAESADLVCYWFFRAEDLIVKQTCARAGLVATNSIRQGANRATLEKISTTAKIFEAHSDQPWVLEGASVRVSIVCFGHKHIAGEPRLNGIEVSLIRPDLSSGKFDPVAVRPLAENAGISFMGTTKVGPFEIAGKLARKWITEPSNPNGKSNFDVVKPWLNGLDVTRRPSDTWIIDFGTTMEEHEAALYEAPYEYLKENVFPSRQLNRRISYQKNWWRHGEPRPAMRRALSPFDRYIATVIVAKYRLFVWCPSVTVPDHRLIVFAKDDDTTFGILHSRFHELWSLRLGSTLEDRPAYTPSTTFETFPFPYGLTPNVWGAGYGHDERAIAIADVARKLCRARDRWLNPAELIYEQPDVVKELPARAVPVDEAADASLRQRTLTELYNIRPTWLDNIHRDLDAAVATAYGWPTDISDDEALARLFELNQARAAAQDQHRMPRVSRRTAEQLRREPEFPPVPLPGNRQVPPQTPAQKPNPLEEPLLATPQTSRRRRRRG